MLNGSKPAAIKSATSSGLANLGISSIRQKINPETISEKKDAKKNTNDSERAAESKLGAEKQGTETSLDTQLKNIFNKVQKISEKSKEKENTDPNAPINSEKDPSRFDLADKQQANSKEAVAERFQFSMPGQSSSQGSQNQMATTAQQQQGSTNQTASVGGGGGSSSGGSSSNGSGAGAQNNGSNGPANNNAGPNNPGPGGNPDPGHVACDTEQTCPCPDTQAGSPNQIPEQSVPNATTNDLNTPDFRQLVQSESSQSTINEVLNNSEEFNDMQSGETMQMPEPEPIQFEDDLLNQEQIV